MRETINLAAHFREFDECGLFQKVLCPRRRASPEIFDCRYQLHWNCHSHSIRCEGKILHPVLESDGLGGEFPARPKDRARRCCHSRAPFIDGLTKICEEDRVMSLPSCPG